MNEALQQLSTFHSNDNTYIIAKRYDAFENLELNFLDSFSLRDF